MEERPAWLAARRAQLRYFTQVPHLSNMLHEAPLT